MISYVQAIVIGVLQGITELFPVSSLGHSVLVPALLGWNTILASQSADESPFLAFLVGLHVATALALLAFFRAEWVGIAARRRAARSEAASAAGRRRRPTRPPRRTRGGPATAPAAPRTAGVTSLERFGRSPGPRWRARR